MTNVAVFDMNETTLDLGPVRMLVDDLLPEAGGFTVWFQRLLQLSMATTATGVPFHDFGTLARHAFQAVAQRQVTRQPTGHSAMSPLRSGRSPRIRMSSMVSSGSATAVGRSSP